MGAFNSVQAQTVNVTYTTGVEVPITSNGFTATGKNVNFFLNYAPGSGTQLIVVKNTSLGFISGSFNNLAHGQAVALSFAATTYNFVANYYGGSGNDLVLHWARTSLIGWGFNGNGQLGNNFNGISYGPLATTVTGVLEGKTVTSIASLGYHSLALCSDGALAAWGSNSKGQLGNNSTVQSNVLIAVTRTTGALVGKTVIAVATGELHSLALCSDGTLAAWGSNTKGQLGNNSTMDSSIPVAVTTTGVLAAKTVIAIAAGEQHSLALCSDGTLAAWGWNICGQLGNNSTADSRVPVAVVNSGTLAGKTAIAISAGYFFSFALCSDGTLTSWGQNNFGELGNNSTINSSVPVEVITRTGVLAGRNVVSISAGIYHSLALCSDGTLATWGRNYYGELGNNSTTDSRVPVAVATNAGLSGKTAKAISSGGFHNLVVCSDGTLIGWGLNNAGQLGDLNVETRVPTVLNNSSLPLDTRFFVNASGARLHSLAIAAQSSISPTVTAVMPSSGSSGGGSSITITGKGFTGVASVTIGGIAATNITLVSDTLITATTPQGTAGPASVVVATIAGGASSANTLYTYLAPNIEVAQNSSVLTDGTSSVNFSTITDSPTTLNFTIANTGNQALTGLVVTKDGPNVTDFTISALSGTSIPMGAGSVSFSVTFSPSAAGLKTAAIRIASNVVGAKNPFDITLTGLALSSQNDTDSDGLDDATEFRFAAEGFDWQVKQSAKVTTFRSNLTASGFYTTAQVQAINLDTPLIQKDSATQKFKLIFGLQKSTNLEVFTPFPMTAPQTQINGEGMIEFNFTSSDAAEFYRIQGK